MDYINMSQTKVITLQQTWPQLPISFNTAISIEAQPFILYSEDLTAEKIQLFADRLALPLSMLDFWQTEELVIGMFKSNAAEQLLRETAHELAVDYAPIAAMPNLNSPGLLVMDMDSTAIQMECIDEIAKLAGVGELVSDITERAMRGELDFAQSLRHRVGTLKNAPESILQQVREQLPLMPGLEVLIKTLKQHGWKTAIASGGFTYFADYLKELLGLDVAVSNQFHIVDGYLTGEVLGDIVDATYKADILVRLAKEFNIDQNNCLAIGDGANDLAMMAKAGLGVAYHAKPKVQETAQVVVNFNDLTALLAILTANSRYQAMNK